MLTDFPGQEAALRRTLEIRGALQRRDRARPHPAAALPRARRREPFDYLVELCEKGLGRRYDQGHDPSCASASSSS